MSRATGTLLVALALLASGAEAAITLELRVDARIAHDVAIHLEAKNLGDEPAMDVRPEVTLAAASVGADEVASIPSQFSGKWDVTLPRPTELGTLPLVVVFHYADAFGHRMSVPAVHQVRTAGSPPSAVAVAVDGEPIVGSATATVRIENREDTAVTGMLRLVASSDLAVTPAERTLDVPAGKTLAVPLRVENRTALPESTAVLWAYVVLQRGSYVDTVVASTTLPIAEATQAKSPAKVALPFVAVAALACLLWAGRRWLAPARGPRSRAHRRRAR